MAMMANHSGIFILQRVIQYAFFAYYPGYAIAFFLLCFFLHRRAYRARLPFLDSERISIQCIVSQNKVGGKYGFYEDSIVDYNKFPSLHPGNSNFMDSFIGQELSRYIYGGFPCSGYNRHNHSKETFLLLNAMKVGTLQNSTPQLLFGNFYQHYQKSTFHLTSSHQVNQSFVCFRFANENIKPKAMLPGIEHVGKYFAITSVSTNISRNYCFCCSMSSNIYNAHVESATQLLNNQIVINKQLDLDTCKDEIELFIKKKKGLSKFIYDISADPTSLKNLFQFKGPFGNGIDLSSSDKVHRMIFLTAGFGSIAIMDVAAYVIRHYMSVYGKENFYNNEQFTYDLQNTQIYIFASFHSDNDVIGKQLFQLASQLSAKYNRTTLSYYLRISDHKDPYWDAKYFRSILTEGKYNDFVYISAPSSLEASLKTYMVEIGVSQANIEIM